MKIVKAVLAALLRAAIFYILFCAAWPFIGGGNLAIFEWSFAVLLDWMSFLAQQATAVLVGSIWIAICTLGCAVIVARIRSWKYRLFGYVLTIAVLVFLLIGAHRNYNLVGPILVTCCLISGWETRDLLSRLERLVSRSQ